MNSDCDICSVVTRRPGNDYKQRKRHEKLCWIIRRFGISDRDRKSHTFQLSTNADRARAQYVFHVAGKSDDAHLISGKGGVREEKPNGFLRFCAVIRLAVKSCRRTTRSHGFKSADFEKTRSFYCSEKYADCPIARITVLTSPRERGNGPTRLPRYLLLHDVEFKSWKKRHRRILFHFPAYRVLSERYSSRARSVGLLLNTVVTTEITEKNKRKPATMLSNITYTFVFFPLVVSWPQATFSNNDLHIDNDKFHGRLGESTATLVVCELLLSIFFNIDNA